MFFSRKKNIVGLDIDSCEIRAVEMSGSPDSPVMENRGSILMPEGAVVDGVIVNSGQVTSAIAALWSDIAFKSKTVIIGLSNQEVLVRFAAFPKVAEDKLAAIIRHQSQEFLPVPLESVVLDYAVIGEVKNEYQEQYEVVLAAARREMLNAFIQTVTAAEITIKDLDVSSLILMKLIPETSKEGASLLVNVANGQTNILIAAGSEPRFSRQVAVSLKDLAPQLGVGVNDLFKTEKQPEPAIIEASTQEFGYNPVPAKSPSDIYNGWTDSLIGEISSSITYYQSQAGALPINEIYLSGKGARVPGIEERTKMMLNLPIKIMQPFGGGDNTGQQLNEELNYSLAFALAIRGLEG